MLSFNGSRTFSKTFNHGSRLESWNTTLRFAGFFSEFVNVEVGQTTFPFVGFKRPQSIFKIVVFPHPDLPKRVRKSDFWIFRSRSLITV